MAGRRIVVAEPHGFCAGVRRAIDAAEAALRVCSPPVYCLHEIVHNRQVVEDLAARGMVFVDDVSAVPPGHCVLFSAHGVSPAVRAEALERGLRAIDATCPFVAKLHDEVRAYAARGFTVLFIGHRGHDEVVGIRGEAPGAIRVVQNRGEAAAVEVEDPGRVAVLTQTTLSVDETARVVEVLRARFPGLEIPPRDGICHATMNRQEAVKLLAARVGCVLVLGSRNSSNTLRLAEVARAAGARAELIDAPAALEAVSLESLEAVGLTAGASTPDAFFRAALEALRARGFDVVETVTAARERLHFRLPHGLDG